LESTSVLNGSSTQQNLTFQQKLHFKRYKIAASAAIFCIEDVDVYNGEVISKKSSHYMSEENSKSTLSFIEISAIILFLIGVIMIFVSRSGAPERDRELRNAVRFQDVSEVADAMWQLSIGSPEFVAELRTLSSDEPCSAESNSISRVEDFLVPEYFEALPQDPSEQDYRFVVRNETRITVCSPFGEDENDEVKLISITR
jgi:hypothetical protein